MKNVSFILQKKLSDFLANPIHCDQLGFTPGMQALFNI